MDFIQELNAANSSGSAFSVAVITAAEGTTPWHPGTKMIVYEDGRLSGTIGAVRSSSLLPRMRSRVCRRERRS